MRSVAIYLLLGLAAAVLALGVVLKAVDSTFGNGEAIKTWTQKGKLGENLALYAPKIAGNIELPDSVRVSAGNQLKDPLGAQLIQPALESFIDQSFSWLNSEAFKIPEFNLDLGTNSQPAIDAITTIIEENYDVLPICDSSNDAFCKTGVAGDESAKTVTDQIVANLTSEEGLFRNIEIMPASDDQAATDNLSTVHDLFSKIKLALPLLVTIWLILSGLAILLSSDHLNGLVSVFRAMTLSMVVPVIFAVVMLYSLPVNIEVQTVSGSNLVADAIVRATAPTFGALARGFVSNFLAVSLPLLAIGIGGWMISRRTLHNERHEKLSV